MPFQNCVARVFKTAAIHRDAPASSGVYGLSNSREWIYIGETGNIQARLLEHLQETNTFLTSRLPTGFSFELCLPADRVARQSRLVGELEPAGNGRPERRGLDGARRRLNSIEEN
jgi:hypothetical protein